MTFTPTWRRQQRRWLEMQEKRAAEEKERRARDNIEREARRKIEAERGSPLGRSPWGVAKDTGYQKIDESDGATWPASVQLVFRHKPTGNLWACRYSIRNDDSDYEMETSWWEVEARVIQKTVYERKSK